MIRILVPLLARIVLTWAIVLALPFVVPTLSGCGGGEETIQGGDDEGEDDQGEDDETADDQGGDDVAAVVCGDGTCDEGETAADCPEDCEEETVEDDDETDVACGNGTCDEGETAESCPEDCEEEEEPVTAPTVAPTLTLPRTKSYTTNNRPTFSWEAVEGATSYELEMSTDPTFPTGELQPTQSFTASTNSYTPDSDKPAAIFFWRVRGVNGGGSGPWSQLRKIFIDRPPMDIDGDGFADAIIGAPDEDMMGMGSGAGRAFYGDGTSISTVNALALTFAGSAANVALGTSVAQGDFNGDGYADVVFGAINVQDGSFQMVGQAYILFGGATPNPVPDVTVTGSLANGSFGWNLAAGDFDGDGYDDLVVGAPGIGTNGSVFLYYGAASMGSTPTADVTFGGAFEGNVGMGGTGIPLAAGDLNNDGLSDLLIGSPMTGDNSEGSVFVYYGNTSGIDNGSDVTLAGTNNLSFGTSVATGDFNGDGADDALIGCNAAMMTCQNASLYFGTGGAVMDTVADKTFAQGANNMMFGTAVSGGDVNGDGFDDAIIGDSATDGDGFGGGAAHGDVSIFFGAATSPADNFNTGLDVTIAGVASGDGLGSDVGAGDFDGDGLDDVLVGAPDADGGGMDKGRAYVVFGQASGMVGTLAVTFTGEDDNSSFGSAVGSSR